MEDPVRMLRAIKYSVTTGCRISFSLKRKIRNSAHLLSPVSPSRLTEELLKIIGSGHSFDIVKVALETDIFMYLQPSASAMMYADTGFEKKYLKHLKELDELIVQEPDARLGKKLVYLIFDFISGLTDWNKELRTSAAAGELYTRTWSECRSFILPMNPQRSELEYAIKTTLKMLGVSVRQSKRTRRHRTFSTEKKVSVTD